MVFTSISESMYLHVRAFPKAKKELLVLKKKGYFDVYVREKAEFHSANKKICEIIASRFGVPPNKVVILNGHNSPSKLLRIITDAD